MSQNRQENWVPRPGELVDGRYLIKKTLDAGGSGVVILAEDQRLGRDVAMKFLHPKVAKQEGYKERFLREVKVATRFDHPNIVRLYDHGGAESAERVYLVMELLVGRSLKQVIREDGPLSTHRTMNICIQMLDGLAHAHAQDIVHRDLKPGNVFVTTNHRGEDIAKVLDFGLAKSVSADDSNLTRTGAICGTAKYIAPEVLVTQAAQKPGDVYAIGLILLEMLQASPVFASPSMAQTFAQHLVAPVRIPGPVWATPLGEVIRRSTMKHPDDRYQDGDEMYRALVDASTLTDDFILSAQFIPQPFEQSFSTEVLYTLGEGQTGLDSLRQGEPAIPYVIAIHDSPTTITSIDAGLKDISHVLEPEFGDPENAVQKSFSPIIVVAIAVAVLLVGAIGWVFYKSHTVRQSQIAAAEKASEIESVKTDTDLEVEKTVIEDDEARVELVDEPPKEKKDDHITQILAAPSEDDDNVAGFFSEDSPFADAARTLATGGPKGKKIMSLREKRKKLEAIERRAKAKADAIAAKKEKKVKTAKSIKLKSNGSRNAPKDAKKNDKDKKSKFNDAADKLL